MVRYHFHPTTSIKCLMDVDSVKTKRRWWVHSNRVYCILTHLNSLHWEIVGTLGMVMVQTGHGHLHWLQPPFYKWYSWLHSDVMETIKPCLLYSNSFDIGHIQWCWVYPQAMVTCDQHQRYEHHNQLWLAQLVVDTISTTGHAFSLGSTLNLSCTMGLGHTLVWQHSPKMLVLAGHAGC